MKRKRTPKVSKKQEVQRKWRYRMGRIIGMKHQIEFAARELNVKLPVEWDAKFEELLCANDAWAKVNGVSALHRNGVKEK